MFLKGMENKSLQVDRHLSLERSKRVSENLQKIRSIVETVISVEGKQLLSEVIAMMHLQYKRIQQQIMETSWLCCSSAFRQVMMCLKST